MIQIEGVTKKFNGKTALRDIDLRVRQGEATACLGPQEAGKSTLIRVISGQLLPDYGTVRINGFNMQTHHLPALRQLGLVSGPQNQDLELSVCENMVLAGLYHELDRSTISKKSRQLLKMARLDDRFETTARSLFGHQRRNLMIARAMIHEPRVLIIDEPTAGIETKFHENIWNLVQQIHKMGTTIFFTTPNEQEAEIFADSVLYISEGRIKMQNKLDKPPNAPFKGQPR